jgi:hypothetical protein
VNCSHLLKREWVRTELREKPWEPQNYPVSAITREYQAKFPEENFSIAWPLNDLDISLNLLRLACFKRSGSVNLLIYDACYTLWMKCARFSSENLWSRS